MVYYLNKMDRILKYADCYDSPSDNLKDDFEFKLNIDEFEYSNIRYNLDNEKQITNPTNEDTEILLNPKIWNSHDKDDNHNFHQKFNELVNKEKFKKFGVIISLT